MLLGKESYCRFYFPFLQKVPPTQPHQGSPPPNFLLPRMKLELEPFVQALQQRKLVLQEQFFGMALVLRALQQQLVQGIFLVAGRLPWEL